MSGEKHQEAREQATREIWNEAIENISESQSLHMPLKRGLLLHTELMFELRKRF